MNQIDKSLNVKLANSLKHNLDNCKWKNFLKFLNWLLFKCKSNATNDPKNCIKIEYNTNKFHFWVHLFLVTKEYTILDKNGKYKFSGTD